jgi:hypothetical protein
MHLLEKELVRIDNEIFLKHTIYDQKVKQYENLAKKRKEKLGRFRTEILLKINSQNENGH